MLAQKKKGVRPFSRFSRGGPPEPATPFDSALRRRRPDLHLQVFPLIDSHPTGLAQGVGAGPSYREAEGGSVSVAGRWGRFPAFRVGLRASAIRFRLLPLLRARVKGSGQECPLYTNQSSGRRVPHLNVALFATLGWGFAAICAGCRSR